jgi:hypothetical protein
MRTKQIKLLCISSEKASRPTNNNTTKSKNEHWVGCQSEFVLKTQEKNDTNWRRRQKVKKFVKKILCEEETQISVSQNEPSGIDSVKE